MKGAKSRYLFSVQNFPQLDRNFKILIYLARNTRKIVTEVGSLRLRRIESDCERWI